MEVLVMNNRTRGTHQPSSLSAIFGFNKPDRGMYLAKVLTCTRYLQFVKLCATYVYVYPALPHLKLYITIGTPPYATYSNSRKVSRRQDLYAPLPQSKFWKEQAGNGGGGAVVTKCLRNTSCVWVEMSVSQSQTYEVRLEKYWGSGCHSRWLLLLLLLKIAIKRNDSEGCFTCKRLISALCNDDPN